MLNDNEIIIVVSHDEASTKYVFCLTVYSFSVSLSTNQTSPLFVSLFDISTDIVLSRTSHMSPCVVIRPPDVVVGRRRFNHDSSICLFSSLFRQLHSELAEWNSTKTGHMLGNEYDLKAYVRNLGYILPVKNGGPKLPFSTTSRLNGKFNSLYLRNEIRYT